MSAVTTHILDIASGRPAAGVPVALERRATADAWRLVGSGRTDADGRARTLMSEGIALEPGVFRLTFDTAQYFARQGLQALYPSVVIVFETRAGESHYHIPLLLSPNGYTTYRGT